MDLLVDRGSKTLKRWRIICRITSTPDGTDIKITRDTSFMSTHGWILGNGWKTHFIKTKKIYENKVHKVPYHESCRNTLFRITSIRLVLLCIKTVTKQIHNRTFFFDQSICALQVTSKWLFSKRTKICIWKRSLLDKIMETYKYSPPITRT